jgi:Protein of unknown function (DUF4038)/Putative collagen-binding domain of a collagenase
MSATSYRSVDDSSPLPPFEASHSAYKLSNERAAYQVASFGISSGGVSPTGAGLSTPLASALGRAGMSGSAPLGGAQAQQESAFGVTGISGNAAGSSGGGISGSAPALSGDAQAQQESLNRPTESPMPGPVPALNDLTASTDAQQPPPPLPPPPPGDPEPGTILVPAGNAVHSGLASHISRGHLVVASNNHHLMHVDGTPFFYLADTAWNASRVGREGIDLYLEDRRAKGFTAVQVVSKAFATDNTIPPNFYGDRPFIGDNPAQPNPAYFAHIDYIIDKAAEKGIYVAFLPWWSNYPINETFFDTTTAFNYGRFLGQRYVNRPNVIWVMGGDGAADRNGAPHLWQAMADGIRNGDGGKFLMTYHSSDEFNGGVQTPPYINFAMAHTGHYAFDNHLSFDWITEHYPLRPIMDGEARYEDDLTLERLPHDGYSTRQAAYWSVFAGALGHTFGNLCIIFFSDPAWNASGFWEQSRYQGYTPARSGTNWTAALNTEGQRSMAHLRKLIDSRPFGALIPDQGLVTDALAGASHIRAARGANYAYVYSATGEPFTVNMGRISGSQVKAYWFDPENGEVTFVGRFANSGQRTFQPPVTPGRGSDRVLILDDAGANYPLPGAV